MRLRLEDAGIDVDTGFDVFFGEDGTTRGDTADERHADLLAHGVHELDAAGCTRHERDDALAGERTQMLLGGIGRLEAQLAGDLRPGGWHAGFVNLALDE